MFKSVLLSLSLLTSIATGAHAQSVDFQNDSSFEIASVSISEVEGLAPMMELPTANPTSIGEIISVIDGMIAVGQKIWKIVDAGRPVITTQFSPSISVLPHLEGENPTLNQMANWSTPSFRSYRVSFKNSRNSELVGFTYTIYFQYNGSFKGKGKYITNLRVDASDIYTSWLFNFDASSELVGIANVGSEESPVASAIMKINYAVRGPLNEVRKGCRFYVDGQGNVQIIP